MDATLNVVSCDLGDEDPFSTTDETMALPGLIETTMTGIDHCPLEEYVNGENEVPVCLDMLLQNYGKKNFLSALADKDDDDDDEDQESEEPSQEPPPQSNIKKQYLH